MSALNPRDGSSFPRKQAQLSNGHIYDYVDAKPVGDRDNTAPTVLLLHGFPDSWFGYRYAIVALVNAGFRCIAPSQLGYYPSSQPDDIAAYGFRAICRDTEELLTKADAPQQILLVGHDWGGHHAWRFAAYYPQRVKAVAVLSTPYTPPASQPSSKYMSTQELVSTTVPNFGYQLWFETQEASELLHKNLEVFFTPSFAQLIQRPPPEQRSNNNGTKLGNLPWSYTGVLQGKFRAAEEARKQGIKIIDVPCQADDPELHFYLDSFRKGGMKHPLNYYRNRKVCFDEEQASKLDTKFPASISALFITGTADAALPLSMSDRSPKYFGKGKYNRVVLDNAGHWMLQDASHRDAVANELVNWAKQNSKTDSFAKAKL